MSDPGSDRMEALTRANVGLLRRVADLERRVEFLESRLREQAPAPPPEPEPKSTPDPVSEPALPPEEPAVAPVAASAQPQAAETRIGLTWLNRVAVLTCILAVAFFFKYAADNEWIGPGGRVALGVLAGLSSLIAADVLWRRGHQIYAQGLCGLGIAILYLSFQAGFAFYHLLPQSAAFALMVLVTAAAGAMSLRYSSPAIAVLALLGGYATPVLLSTGEKNTWFLLSYVFLLNLGARLLGRWPALQGIALAATVVLYAGGLGSTISAGERVPAALFAVFYWVQFLWSRSWAVVYIAHFFACFAAALVWEKSLAGFALTILGFTAGLLALGDRRDWPAAPSVAFTSFWAWYGVWAAFFIGDPGLGAEAALLTAVFALFLAWTPWRISVRSAAVTQPDLVLIALNAILFSGRLYSMLEHDYTGWRGLLAVALAAVHLLLARFLWNSRPAGSRDKRPVLLLLGVSLTLLTLAAPIQFSSYRITMAWAVEGAVLAWIAARTGSRPLAAGSLLVCAATVVRVIGVDAGIYAFSEYSLIANARFATFLVAAVSLGLGARWIREVLPPVPAAAVYVAAHGTMLSGLGLEVGRWASLTAAPENVRNLTSAVISLVIALYAVALAAAGIATRTRIHRVLGLSLIALVVAKLYLFDVWELRLIYRVLAFAGLGGLLLVMSFLYSRYRSSIESWLQDEKTSP